MRRPRFVPKRETVRRWCSEFIERVREPWAAAATLAVAASSIVAVCVLFLSESPPRAEAMPSLAAVDVGLLIALAIERFSTVAGEDERVRRNVAGIRTVPTSVALLAALIGTTVELHDAARWVAAVAFVLTALGVLAVCYSALDRATDTRVSIPPAGTND